MFSINRRIKNVNRIRQIVSIFVKYGFKDIINRIPRIQKFIPRKVKTRFMKRSTEERLRLALEELGPAFIKLGQFLSVRSDILPKSYIEELSKLQDEVESISFPEIKHIVESEMGKDIDEIFNDFNKEPIASASLAQVYRAKLKNGKEVVVKVQRPGIKKKINTDINILKAVAKWAEKEIKEARDYEPSKFITNLKHNLQNELRFTREGTSIQRFRKNFRHNKDVLIPQLYRRHCSSKMLTMEYVKGFKITSPEVQEKTELTNKEILEIGLDFVFKQIFKHKFFHADPHPGNILVTEEGKISLVDFGLTGNLDDDTIDLLGELLIAGEQKDVERIIEVLIELGVTEELAQTSGLRGELKNFIEQYYGISLEDVEVKEILDDIFNITRRHKLKMPRNLLLLAKTLSTAEGVAFQLEPRFNVIEELKPYIRKILRQRLSPGYLTKKAKRIIRSYIRLLRNLPGDINSILKELKDGQLKVEFEHRGLDDLILHGEKSLNRLSFSLIIASIIIGSALIIQTESFFILGLIGFSLAGILGIALIIAMFRSRGL